MKTFCTLQIIKDSSFAIYVINWGEKILEKFKKKILKMNYKVL